MQIQREQLNQLQEEIQHQEVQRHEEEQRREEEVIHEEEQNHEAELLSEEEGEESATEEQEGMVDKSQEISDPSTESTKGSETFNETDTPPKPKRRFTVHGEIMFWRHSTPEKEKEKQIKKDQKKLKKEEKKKQKLEKQKEKKAKKIEKFQRGDRSSGKEEEHDGSASNSEKEPPVEKKKNRFEDGSLANLCLQSTYENYFQKDSLQNRGGNFELLNCIETLFGMGVCERDKLALEEVI